MIPLKKKILLIIAFVVATLVLPAVILLLFVDALYSFATYVVVFGLILFVILGFLVVNVFDIQLTLKKTVEELKMQNAAIAYKLSNQPTEQQVSFAVNDVNEFKETVAVKPEEPVQHNVEASTIGKVNLNPAEPLVMPQAIPKAAEVVEKKTDDGFDDFQ